MVMRKRNKRIEILKFSKSEVRGLLILVVLILLLLAARIIMNKSNQVLSMAYQDTLVVSEKENKNFSTNNDKKEHVYQAKKDKKIVSTEPVELNSDGFARLVGAGIPEEVSKHILAYRKKGGSFSKPEDLLKIHGVDSSLFLSVQQHIRVKPAFGDKNNTTFKFTNSHFVVELNRADSIDLIRLPGIGHKLSGRMIKYRDALGGFYSTHQLTEVYGITDSLCQSIAQYLVIDTTNIRKIHLNAVNLEELQKHPYLNRYLAKAILGYRRLVGSFTNVEQLLQNYLIPEENYYKIVHYLTVE
jgi:competence protein ComEA